MMAIRPLLARITRIIILGTVLLWIAWDLFAFNVGGLPASISGIVKAWGCQYPQAVAGVFYVLGHLTWGQKNA
jgi:hypothetical protein